MLACPRFEPAIAAYSGPMGGQVTQHINSWCSVIDGRTARHPGYAVSQFIRQRIEEVFGWGQEIGGMRRTLPRGLDRVGWSVTLRLAAYNLVGLSKILGNAA